MRVTELEDVDGLVTDAEVEAWHSDGVICLRGRFAGRWVDSVARGLERNLLEPGPLAVDHVADRGAGRFFDDYCNWSRIPQWSQFVFDSPAAAIAARVMRSKTAQFFHEHVLVKEPNTDVVTPWHRDEPYYCVRGQQMISIWLALDFVPRKVCPQFVAGSQHWSRAHCKSLIERGLRCGTEGSETLSGNGGDSEARQNQVLSWELEPGDALLFHFLTVHGAPGNPGTKRRRGFVTRWLGDDVTYADRPNVMRTLYPNIGLRDGEKMRTDWFPIAWPPSARS